MDQSNVAAARSAAMVQLQSKNVALGVILTLFFGGLGMLYTSVLVGIICIVVEFILFLSVFVGIGIILLPLFHIFCVILTIVMINNHNSRLLSRVYG